MFVVNNLCSKSVRIKLCHFNKLIGTIGKYEYGSSSKVDFTKVILLLFIIR